MVALITNWQPCHRLQFSSIRRSGQQDRTSTSRQRQSNSLTGKTSSTAIWRPAVPGRRGLYLNNISYIDSLSKSFISSVLQRRYESILLYHYLHKDVFDHHLAHLQPHVASSRENSSIQIVVKDFNFITRLQDHHHIFMVLESPALVI